MGKERILVTVKTYPALSSTYDEIVCTAGLREDGSWVRIYPIPFRKLDDYEKYSKFDWIEVDLERNSSDPRHESFKLKSEISVQCHMGRENDWWERRSFVLETGTVYTSFDEIIALNKHNHSLSLATFKPSQITGFHIEEDTPDWDAEKLLEIEQKAKQTDLFRDTSETFKVVKKLPYKFRYAFRDETGKERKLMISDWEIGMLYWNELKRHKGNVEKTLESVRYKYMQQLVEGRDIHFFVGTTKSHDLKNAPNPFIIIGVFSPPIVLQNQLF